MYRAEITARLIAILSEAPAGLPELVVKSEGAYPTEVRSELESLQVIGKAKVAPNGIWMLVPSDGELASRSQPINSTPRRVPDSFFPEPHALDFDWRFTSDTLEFLGRYISDFRVRSVAVLGAPTLFKYLSDRGTNARLFDNNTQVVKRLQQAGYCNVTECDLLHYIPKGEKSDCAVVDPPWYLEHYSAFIEAGRRLLARRGKLLVSMLPRLTRPSATADRAQVLTFAFERGFELLSVDASPLHYASPSFEVAALQSEGIHLTDWRSADLYTFGLTARPVRDLEVPPREGTDLWETFQVGRTVIKIKLEGGGSDHNFEFKEVPGVANMRLKSVSRRSPARPHINLWTSRNLVAHVTGSELLRDALRLLQRGMEACEAVAALSADGRLRASEKKPLEKLLTLLLNESRS
jgi:hypothetical protein